MTPNKNSEKEFILFQCECHSHYLEVWYEEFQHSIIFGSGLWFNFIDYPNSFWQVIKWWWKQRKLYWSDICLNPDDVRNLRDKLNQYLDEFEAAEFKNKQKQLDLGSIMTTGRPPKS